MEKLKEKKKIKSKKNQERGITLIALVITIIVLIILSGVTVAAIIGNNGIITQTINAKNQTEIAGIKERVLIDILEAESQSRNVITKEQFVGILGNYFVDVPTADELPDDLSTLILTTKDEYGKHNINISEIYNGDFSDTVVIAEKTIEDLKVGDKVYYIDKNNVKRECIVLYDSSSEYGVQIITADVVEDTVTLGKFGDGSATITSYNNSLKTLYEEAQKYLNTIYASEARCVGSDPADPDWDDAMTIQVGKYYTLKNEDQNYNVDWTQMESIANIDIKVSGSSYWLASRTFYSSYPSTSAISFGVLYVDDAGLGNSSGYRLGDVDSLR